MAHRFVDDFDVILFDQGKTFIFENDRFGPDEDYLSVYQSLGGNRLSSGELHRIVQTICHYMLESSRSREANFPSIEEAVRAIPHGIKIHETELPLLDDLVAIQETGTISEPHRRVMHSLAQTHRLGVVSNIWASPPRFEQNLEDAGILECFEIVVWSSNYGCLKPSPRLFQVALDHFEVEPKQIVYVGDHPRRDVEGSKSLGMSAIWVDNPERKRPMGRVHPDLIVNDICELLIA